MNQSFSNICSFLSDKKTSEPVSNRIRRFPFYKIQMNMSTGLFIRYTFIVVNPQTCFYINPANTEAAITVRSPATAIARLLIAPSTGPSSIALDVPMA